MGLRNKSGRRFQDKLVVKTLSLYVAFYVGHLITFMFPDINFIAKIMEISTVAATIVRTFVDAIGGVSALAAVLLEDFLLRRGLLIFFKNFDLLYKRRKFNLPFKDTD